MGWDMYQDLCLKQKDLKKTILLKKMWVQEVIH